MCCTELAHDLHMIGPGPLEHRCWTQFAAQWGDCKNLELFLSMWLLLLLLLLLLSLNLFSLYYLWTPFHGQALSSLQHSGKWSFSMRRTQADSTAQCKITCRLNQTTVLNATIHRTTHQFVISLEQFQYASCFAKVVGNMSTTGYKGTASFITAQLATIFILTLWLPFPFVILEELCKNHPMFSISIQRSRFYGMHALDFPFSNRI